MKKILAILLAAVMGFALLAACEETDPPEVAVDTPSSSVSEGDKLLTPEERRALAADYGLPYWDEMDNWEPITLTYFNRNAPVAPAASNPYMKVIEQITNVSFIWDMNVGDLSQTMGTMHAPGGTLPDIAFFGGANGEAIETNNYLPLEDLIEEHAPNLRAHFDPWWELMKANILNDGHIYTLDIWSTNHGEATETYWSNQTAFWIQKAVLDHFGYAPDNLDDYFDMLREYAEIYPEIDGVPTKPFLIRNVNDANGRFSLSNAGIFLIGNSNWGDYALNADGPGVDAAISPDPHLRWVNEGNYTWWKKLNEEYWKGTFTEETFTLDNDAYLAEIASGAVLGINDQAWHGVNSATDPFLAEGRPERGYMPIGITINGATPNYLDASDPKTAFTGNNGINISVDNPDPVRTIKYLDWLILHEVQRFMSWGVEGVDWFFNDNGIIERYPQAREQQKDTQWVTDNMARFLRDQFPKIQGRFPDGNAADTGGNAIEYYAGLSEYDQYLFDKLGIDRQTAYWGEPTARPPYYPFWSMGNPPVGTPAQLAKLAIDEARTKIAPMIISPEDEFEDAYKAFCDEILAIDVEELAQFFVDKAEERVAASAK